jgi:hypothetical protein
VPLALLVAAASAPADPDLADRAWRECRDEARDHDRSDRRVGLDRTEETASGWWRGLAPSAGRRPESGVTTSATRATAG